MASDELTKRGRGAAVAYIAAVRDRVFEQETPEQVASVVQSMRAYACSDARSAPMAARVYLDAISKLLALATAEEVSQTTRMLDEITDASEARLLLEQFRAGVAMLERKVRELGG